MPTAELELETLANQDYKYGFVSDIESESAAPGLNEDTVRFISAKKNEPQWMLDWRLKAFRHWLTLEEPHHWGKLHYDRIDYQATSYFSAPKKKLASLDEVDPELLAIYEKLGVPIGERKKLLGVEETADDSMPKVAVDAVFDSVSVTTTFKKKLGELGVIFCSFGEAVVEHPDSCASTSPRSSRTPTTTTPRSTRPSSPTGRSSTSPRA
jgi:Fe-S cluster assembly protein SufB